VIEIRTFKVLRERGFEKNYNYQSDESYLSKLELFVLRGGLRILALSSGERS